ncbi:MAG TPA: right-handed parallel beta-helix repeat-containing protein [Chitinophagales bacterium]|nr:right-handed parallel beta-helix repeat-containing protein [Chitinophagales bacterium]
MFIFLLCVVSHVAIGQTVISDNDTIFGTWTLAGSPYLLGGRAVIPANQELTIEAGVVVKFRSLESVVTYYYEDSVRANMLVLGKLTAIGTQGSPILFTRMGTGNWGGVIFHETSDTTSRIEGCVFEYGRGTQVVPGVSPWLMLHGAVNVYGARIHVRNNIVRFNYNNGIGIYNCGGNTQDGVDVVEVTGNTVYGNRYNGIYAKDSEVFIAFNECFENSNITCYNGVISVEGCNTIICNNLVYNNLSHGIYAQQDTVGIYNNTCANNAVGIYLKDVQLGYVRNNISVYSNTFSYNLITTGTAPLPKGIYYDHNLFSNASALNNYTGISVTNYTYGSLNVAMPFGDPLFVDTANHDFRILPQSLARNAGVDTGLYITTHDFDGANRIDGLHIDIGCYEVDGTVFPVYHSAFDTICIGSTLFAYGHEYASTGMYFDTLLTAFGTDSVNVTHLFVSEPAASFDMVPDIGQSNAGSITASATGGVPPYIYSWGNPLFVESPSVYFLANGLYELTVTDARGCSTSTTLTLGETVLSEGNHVIHIGHLTATIQNGLLTFSGGFVEGQECLIFDQFGHVVKRSTAASGKIVVDLRELDTGFYIAHGNAFTLKFISY